MPLPRPRSEALTAARPTSPQGLRAPAAAAEPPHGPCRIAEGTAAGPSAGASGASAGPSSPSTASTGTAGSTGPAGPFGPAAGGASVAQRRRRPIPLAAFNALPAAQAESALLCCCGSGSWAARVAAHRPYPDVEALLAAADEASYDMTAGDLDEALAGESARHPLPFFYEGCEAAEHGQRGVLAAHTALQAAHAAYQGKFGHAYLICLDGYQPVERLDRTLTDVRDRLANEADEERAIAAEELRRLARGRLSRLVPAER